MPIRKKIAQMLFFGFEGQDTSQLEPWLLADGLGGVILFSKDPQQKTKRKNISTLQQVQALNKSIQAIGFHEAEGVKYPIFIAIDHEGGVVDRFRDVKDYKGSHSPAQQSRLSISQQKAYFDAQASFLNLLGFNVNLAPCVDLAVQKKQGIIAARDRSYGDDPETVSDIAQRFIDAHIQYHMHCAIKHYPGHGSALGDTHENCVDVTETFQPEELHPYEILSKTTLPFAVMTAHVINRQLDKTGYPATLSAPMIQRLRQSIGEDRIIMTDCMQMQAIRQDYPLETALMRALLAGVDMFIFANQLDNIEPKTVIDMIEKLVNEKKIDLALIERAYQRILKMKSLLCCTPTHERCPSPKP